MQQLQRLRSDLQRIQALAELCRKREVRKFRQAEVIHEVLSRGLFSHDTPLRQALKRVMEYVFFLYMPVHSTKESFRLKVLIVQGNISSIQFLSKRSPIISMLSRIPCAGPTSTQNWMNINIGICNLSR